jgi:hypothetical protein
MLDGHRIVCVTPAGRRRYLRLLIPYVLACPLVDRYDLWVNTPDGADLAFIEAVAQIDDRIRLVPLPEGKTPDTVSIHAFWPGVTDPDTVYVRFDDDVVWVDPRFFETLLSFRLQHPEYFLVAPLIINNAMSSFLLQTFRKITMPRLLSPDRFDTIGWVNPNFARSLHEFLQKLAADGEVEKLNCGRIPLSGTIFSINCIAWFGRDFASFGGKVPEDEEPAVSCTIPLRAGRLNAMETGAIVAHFAFFTQRETMDRSGLLDGYLRLAAARAELEPWRSRVESTYAKLEERYPLHLSVGGTRPRRERPPSLLKRLLPRKRTERSSNKKDHIGIERGSKL